MNRPYDSIQTHQFFLFYVKSYTDLEPNLCSAIYDSPNQQRNNSLLNSNKK
jgi:hypothetical protein